MNIVGAGLTGCIAACVFKEADIHEYLKKPVKHEAVLRFRSEDVSVLTGIPFKKVVVTKGVVFGNKFVTPNIRLANLYSKKVTGGYYDRSISDISSQVRYIAPEDFHEQLLNRLEDRIQYGSDVDLENAETPIISTIPLGILMDKLRISGITLDIKDASPIFVTTAKIQNADLYQTIYYPEFHTDVYRASFTGNKLIIESIKEIDVKQLEAVLTSFGITWDYDVKRMNFEQKNGKFIQLDEDLRKAMMYHLTNDYGIYSLGRHATWRKVMLDDIANDITRIKQMITKTAYDRMLGK